MFLELENNNEPEDLSLEAEFVRHTLSLFGTLYDNRAFPYIGNVDYDVTIDDDEIIEEEEEDVYDPHPPFESMLCNFRTRETYNNELNSRKGAIEEITAKEEIISEIASKPESDNLVIGEHLQPHNTLGKTLEEEMNKKRKEGLEKSQYARNKRRELYLSTKKNATMDAGRKAYKESKDIIAYIEKMKRAEENERHKFAEKRKEEMLRRREKQIEKKEIELQKQEEARRAINNITYRSNRKDTLDFRAREKEARKEQKQMTLNRMYAKKKANEQCKTLKSKVRIGHKPVIHL